jgi:hypothetical protein
MPCTKPYPITVYEVQWCTYQAKGVDNMAKIRNTETPITIVKPKDVLYRRKTNRYNKRKGTFSSHVQYLLVGRDEQGRWKSLRV